MGMSVPEARTRVTPFESHQLRDIHLDTTRIHSAFAAPKLTLHVSWRRRESKRAMLPLDVQQTKEERRWL